MGNLILLLVVACCIAPMSAYFGNVSFYIMSNESLVAVVLYPLAFVPALWAAYHICCSLYQHTHAEVSAEDFVCRMGLLHMVIMLCMGYLYGFTAVPFTGQFLWWSWTLIFPVIGLLSLLFILVTVKKCNWT